MEVGGYRLDNPRRKPRTKYWVLAPRTKYWVLEPQTKYKKDGGKRGARESNPIKRSVTPGLTPDLSKGGSGPNCPSKDFENGTHRRVFPDPRLSPGQGVHAGTDLNSTESLRK